ncbi:MAG: DNA-formamidopyrimidine glycosylase [Synergistes sp.]|nr:DNA-formamidopyrimidine glycosylase [Synergistes sp.]
MPELPEVETVRRITEQQVKGQTVLSVRIFNEKVIAYPDRDTFASSLCGKTITAVGRRGKYLLFPLDNGDRLFLHLRMTGQLLVTPKDHPMEKHTHFAAELSGGKQLRYVDVRRFGRFWYLKKDEPDGITGADKLGPEPDDPKLTASYLKEKLKNKKNPVKEMLHDQTVIAGIGNIYSDEILFASRIYPNKKCCDLTDEEWKRLAETIPVTIAYYTIKNAVTPEEYLKGQGKDYKNTPYLKVYGRAGMPCPVCGTALSGMRISGRSSVYCTKCQPDRS